MLPPVVGKRLARKGVGKFRVPEESTAQKSALQCVVREDALRGEIPGNAQQAARVENALSGKAAAAEGVHIQLPAQRPVGVAAARSGEQKRKIGGRGRGQERGHARVDDRVPRRDDALFLVQRRRVERVQHGSDQLAVSEPG